MLNVFIIFVILCHCLSTWSSVFTLCVKGLPLVVAFFSYSILCSALFAIISLR